MGFPFRVRDAVARLDLERSLRRPVRVAGEEAVNEPNLMDEKDTETDACEPGDRAKHPTKMVESPRDNDDGHGERHRDERHPDDGPAAEHEQVDHAQDRIADGPENEEGDGGGPRQSVYDTDTEWT
jgi:hypothetical protein